MYVQDFGTSTLILSAARRVTPSGNDIPGDNHLSGGAIFGIIVGVIVGVCAIGFALWYYRSKWMPAQREYANL